jgi:N-acetylglutamate synthase-like GNAT family acetyltransferase
MLCMGNSPPVELFCGAIIYRMRALCESLAGGTRWTAAGSQEENQEMGDEGISIGVIGDDGVRIDQALAVLREGLGQGYITNEQFRRYAGRHGERAFRSVLTATDNGTGRVIGVLTIEIVDARAIGESLLDHYEHVRMTAEIRRLQSGSTGLIKSIAVSTAYRGRGVATALIARGIQDLAEHGANHIYSLAWMSQEHGCALCRVLSALGFRSVWRIERFWHHDSLVNGYHCPACGNPCECSAHVMIRWSGR